MRDKLFTGFAIAFAGLIVLVGYRTLDLYWQIRALRSRIETVRSARGPADFHTVLLDESWYEVSDSAEPDEPNCAERILLFALTEECTNCLGALKWIAVDVMREPPACTEAWILAVDGIAGRAVDAAGAMLAGTGVA